MSPKSTDLGPAPVSATPVAVTTQGLLNLASVLDRALDGHPLPFAAFAAACKAAGKDVNEMLMVMQGSEILVVHDGYLRLGPMGYALILSAYMG